MHDSNIIDPKLKIKKKESVCWRPYLMFVLERSLSGNSVWAALCSSAAAAHNQQMLP